MWETSLKVQELFQSASEALRIDMKKLLFDSTEEQLKATDKTQVAMTLACLCSSAVLKERGVTPAACAGFSLGEYAALCEAAVLKIADVFPIVRIRGELMEKAARSLDSTDGPPGMAAVLGLSAEKTVSTVESLAASGVYAANYNSPAQVVISGTARGLARAETELKAAGAKRLVRLQVSGPFHSPLMAEARDAFQAALDAFEFADPKITVYSNVTGKKVSSGKEARQLCATQLVSMVRWVDVQEGLFSDGCERFFEVGPGTVLTGLLRALRPQTPCFPAGTLVAVGKALEQKE
jgi:[acyl-carrier-protein] S-malonyltransferase